MIKEIGNWWISHYKGIITFVCFIVFIAILEDVLTNETMKADVFMYNLVIHYLRQDWLTPVMYFFTTLGSAYVMIPISIIGLIIYKGKKKGWLISINALMITLINQGIKYLVQRPRPEGYRIIEETGYSFPSGHSMVSMAFYGLMIIYIYKSHLPSKCKNLLVFLLGITIIMIGFSRIYLGVHYTSDVIAGFSISLVYLYCLYKYTKVGVILNEV